MRYIIALAAMLAATLALAETKTVTWVNATKNTDQSNIPASGEGRLVRTVVEYGTRTAQGGFGTKQGEIGIAAPATTLQLNLVVVQEYALRAFHCNTYAGTTYVLNGTGCSAASNVHLTTVAPPKPEPPTSLTVAADLTAWTVVTTEGAIVALEVGQVEAGAACDASQSVLPFGRTETLYRVPESAVTFLPGQTALVTFAACSGG